MNILYCGDHNIEDGLLLSILSLLKHVKEPLSIYVLTMPLSTPEKEFRPVSDAMIAALDETVKKQTAGVLPERSIFPLFLSRCVRKPI